MNNIALSAMNTGRSLKPIHFHVSGAKNYADVEHQIVEHLRQELAQAGVAVTQSRSAKQGALTISCFIRQKADIYIGHNLADKNYLLLRDENGQAYINHFQHVFVQGHWLRRRLLGSRHCHLKPHQIHVIGAPRVDYLRELAAETPTPSAKRKVLWAPTHDKWLLRGEALSAYPALEAYLDHELIAGNKNLSITRVPHPRNRENKQAVTQELVNADVVISDYSSVIYEAWALGKPVIFPRWLLGDKVFEKSPDSAEAHIYRESLGYHPQSVEELSVLLESELTISDEVTAFMQDYVHNFSSSGVAKQVSTLLERIASSDFIAQQEAHYAQLQAAMDAEDWGQANTELSSYVTQYNQGLPLPDTQRVSSYQQVIAKATTKRAMAEYKAAVAEKRWLDAENAMRNLLEYVHDDAQVYNRLAQVLRKQGKWWQEIEALKSATALENQHPTWHYRLGEAQEVMNRYQQAAEAYGKAIELKGGKTEATWYYRQGYCFASEGHDGPANQQAAEHAYAMAVEKDKKLNAQRFGVGVFHQQRGHWQQAAKAYQAQLEIRVVDAELYYKLGMAHDRCYEWAKAEEAYKNALTIDIERFDWHYRLGFVLERQDKLNEATLSYRYAALNRDRHTPYWFYRCAYVLEKQGKYHEAALVYLQTRLQQSIDKPAVQAIAHGSSQTLDSDRRLEDSQPGEFSENHDLDTLLQTYTRQFDTKKLITKIGELLERDTTNPEDWYQLGNAYERLQDWIQAAEAYQHAVARANEHKPDWFYRLGYVLVQCNEHKRACEALRHTRILQSPYGVSDASFNKNEGFRHAATYTELYESMPLQAATVLYESFHGTSMSCNPYAIFLQLLQLPKYENYTHIWVVNDVGVVPEIFKRNKNIIFVKRDSYCYYRWLVSANYLINNSTFPACFIRKSDQYYLNTWHGTPWKTLGKDIKNSPFEFANTARNFLHTTHLLSQNSHTTHVLTDRYDIGHIYTGRVFESGYPRLDLTLNASEQSKNTLKNLLGLDHSKPVVLYAPTWRGSLGSASSEVDSIICDLEALQGIGVNVVFRGHYFVESSIYSSNIGYIVVPDYINTNELLSIVDVLITDYSSIAFDFMATSKPIIYYLNDLESYQEERGLYFDVTEMPGEYASDIFDVVGLLEKSLNITECHENYINCQRKFLPYDTGCAAQHVIEYFFENNNQNIHEVSLKRKKNVLMFGGEFQPNGITTSLLNLLNNIDENKLSLTLLFDTNLVLSTEDQKEQFGYLPEYVHYAPRVGRMNRTIEEAWIEGKVNQYRSVSNAAMSKMYEKMYAREFQRMFGNSYFEASVNFTGYSKFWSALQACSPLSSTGIKAIYQHNDKYGEWVSRFPSLEAVFDLYNKYDRVVSVSEQTMHLNKSNLASRFFIGDEKFIFADNVQNPNKVLELAEEDIDLDDQCFFEDASCTFITLGRLSVEKDQEKLIRAFTKIVRSHPNAKLLILGDGPLRQHLNHLILQLRMNDNVYLLGRRSNPFSLLKRADCFVLSSNHEGQPMVLFEAMILQKPIISTDIVGSRSAIEGRSGTLVENSEQGLAQGMLDFINGDLAVLEYDITDYQENALNMFYEKVCGFQKE